jgi:hypothetical protein
MNLLNIKDKHDGQPASTFCLCWTAVVVNNAFSDIYVRLGRFVQCCRAHYVTEVLICCPYIMHTQYIYTVYVYVQCVRKVAVHLGYGM